MDLNVVIENQHKLVDEISIHINDLEKNETLDDSKYCFETLIPKVNSLIKDEYSYIYELQKTISTNDPLYHKALDVHTEISTFEEYVVNLIKMEPSNHDESLDFLKSARKYILENEIVFLQEWLH